jgi:hypothetical protein
MKHAKDLRQSERARTAVLTQNILANNYCFYNYKSYDFLNENIIELAG